jgi:hypothetical protein
MSVEPKLRTIDKEVVDTTISQAQKHGWLHEGVSIPSVDYLLSTNNSVISNRNFQTMLTIDATYSASLRITEEALFGIPALFNSLLRRQTSKEGSLVAVAWQGRDLKKGSELVTNVSYTVLQKRAAHYAFSEGLVNFPDSLIDIVLYNPKGSIDPEKLDGSEAKFIYNSIIQDRMANKIEKWNSFSKKYNSKWPCEIKEAIDLAVQYLRFGS